MTLPVVLLNLIQRMLMMGWAISAGVILFWEYPRIAVHGTGWPAETSWMLIVMSVVVILASLVGLVRGLGFRWVHGLGICLWVAMIVETLVWQQHAEKVCEQLRRDPYCELKNDGYHCKRESAYGDSDFPPEFCEVKKLTIE